MTIEAANFAAQAPTQLMLPIWSQAQTHQATGINIKSVKKLLRERGIKRKSRWDSVTYD